MVAVGAAPAETAPPAADGKALEYCIIHLFSFFKKTTVQITYFAFFFFFSNIGTTPAEGAPPAADAAAPPPPADGKSRY